MEEKSNVLADYVSYRLMDKVVGLYNNAAFDLRGEILPISYMDSM